VRTLLIVEDEETIRWALRELFMQDGWQVESAETGDDAIETLRQRRFDYMITDLKMPGASGIDVVREGRRRAPDMGVAVLTGYASLETAIESLRLGVWDYVTKPCKVSYLKERAEEFLERRGRGANKEAARPFPDEETVARFVRGAGTEVLSRAGVLTADETRKSMLSLEGLLRDLGCEEEPARQFLQLCLDGMAAIGEDQAQCRVGFLEGHLMAGFAVGRDVTHLWCRFARALGHPRRVHARHVRQDGLFWFVISGQL